MKIADFVSKLKLAHDVPNYYNNKFPYNCGYYDGARFSFDCWNLVKAILGGWTDNYKVGYYVSPKDFPTGDVDGYHLLLQCTDRSKDFSQLKTIGTYLYINNSPHAGVYLGDFEYNGHIVNVVECTGAWEHKVQYTYVDNKGDRYRWKGGEKNPYSWTDFGILPYIDYDGGKMSEFRGIDVSVFQPNIDWAKVKASGIDFAIIKAGGSECGRFKDRTFEYNYQNARANGVKLGCYFMGGKGFTSYEAGVADAQYFLTLLSGKTFDYPCYIDLELPTSATKKGNTEACIAFCDTVKKAGYKTGIYASDISGFNDRLELNRLKAYDKWVARYGSKPTYVKEYQVWQYTSKGIVKGISGNVDCNISYKDYSADTPIKPSYYYMGTDFAPVFDPDFYADKYPDLENAFGHNADALWNHFIVYGMYEFRQASAEFNPVIYRDRYNDLKAVFGDNRPLYYWHYCYFGKSEGRTAV